MVEDFRISSDFEEMDLDAIHAYLSTSYWAGGIPMPTLKKAMKNSLCFGVEMAIARAIIDHWFRPC